MQVFFPYPQLTYPEIYFAFLFFLILFYFYTLQYCISFAKHRNESATVCISLKKQHLGLLIKHSVLRAMPLEKVVNALSVCTQSLEWIYPGLSAHLHLPFCKQPLHLHQWPLQPCL